MQLWTTITGLGSWITNDTKFQGQPAESDGLTRLQLQTTPHH